MGEPKQKEGAPPPAEPDEGRRGALRSLVVLGGVAYAGAVAAPAALFVTSSAAAPGGARWTRTLRLADLAPGVPRRIAVVGDERDAFTLTKDQVLGSAWVVREGGAVRALSATCPHLGCAIDLTADKGAFACPCHTSSFALGGEVRGGPSPRGMDPLAARVVDGFVEIDFRRFRTGIAAREEQG